MSTDGTGTGSSTTTLEQYTIAQIPLDERHGKTRDLFTVWFASNVMPLTIVTGALAPLAFGLPFWWGVISIVVGNLAGGLFMALHSAQGPRLGIPQMIQSRAQYGVLGATLVVVIAIVMYLGFFASNLALGGESINQVFHGVSVNTGILICALGSLLITIFGYDLIHALNRWFTWLFGGVMILTFVLVLAKGLPSDFFTAGAFTWAAFGGMISIGALWQIAYAPYVSDYSRYMPADEGVGPTFWASFWGCTLGSILPMVLGVVVAIAAASAADAIVGIHDLTGAWAPLIMLVFALGLIDTNVLNLYSGVLCVVTVGQTFKNDWLPGAGVRAIVSTVFTVLSLLIALVFAADFLTNYLNFILFLLYLLVPWTAINLVDYYVVRKGHYDVDALFRADGGIYGRTNWVGLAVYTIGVLVQLPFINTTLYQGPVSKSLGGADIAWLVGLVVTTVVYLLAVRLFPGADHIVPEPALGV